MTITQKLKISLTQLTIAVKVSQELTELDKQHFLKAINLIQEEMQKSQQERNVDLIKNKIKDIKTLTTGTQVIQTLWNAYHPLILVDEN